MIASSMLANALCPLCGRPAIYLGDDQFQCQSCGRLGLEPVTPKHFVEFDGKGIAILDQPASNANIRWACGVIPGCTHDTEADANRHRKDFA